MDWDNVVVIILMAWVVRYLIGAGFGIYFLRKDPVAFEWDWQSQYVCGIPFWIVYIFIQLIANMKRAIESKYDGP